DATGRYLTLVATLNAARVLGATAGMLGTDPAGFDRLALAASPGADGLVLLPYLDGERTPALRETTGSLHKPTHATMTPAHTAPPAAEGMLLGLADGLATMTDIGIPLRRILLVGGAARSEAVRTTATTVFGVPVQVPPPAEYVALGAARQAAWALAGTQEPPEWDVGKAEYTADPVEVAGLRERYAEVRRATHGV